MPLKFFTLFLLVFSLSFVSSQLDCHDHKMRGEEAIAHSGICAEWDLSKSNKVSIYCNKPNNLLYMNSDDYCTETGCSGDYVSAGYQQIEIPEGISQYTASCWSFDEVFSDDWAWTYTTIFLDFNYVPLKDPEPEEIYCYYYNFKNIDGYSDCFNGVCLGDSFHPKNKEYVGFSYSTEDDCIKANSSFFQKFINFFKSLFKKLGLASAVDFSSSSVSSSNSGGGKI